MHCHEILQNLNKKSPNRLLHVDCRYNNFVQNDKCLNFMWKSLEMPNNQTSWLPTYCSFWNFIVWRFKAIIKLFSYKISDPIFCVKILMTLSRVRKWILFKCTFLVLQSHFYFCFTLEVESYSSCCVLFFLRSQETLKSSLLKNAYFSSVYSWGLF